MLVFYALVPGPLQFQGAVSLFGQSAPNFPDITHPQTILNLGQQLLKVGGWMVILLGGLGLVLAWINRSYGRQNRPDWLALGFERYALMLRSLQHVALVGAIAVVGFFLCTTLANRYHHWEQDRVSRVAQTVEGDRLEHIAPQLRYLVEEPYTVWVQDRGRPVELIRTQKIPRFLTLAGSQIQVKLNQIQDVASEQLLYTSQFEATYQVRNSLSETTDFTFEAPPPSGYRLIQGYRIERDGQPLEQKNPGDYGFPLRLAPGESAELRVTYQAQGGPRWVYNSNSQLLSNFKLTAIAQFPKADFASGIIPTETKSIEGGSQFTWVFADNVSVRNPFGVFTGTERIRNRGFLPRLLLLAPLILLWWLGLLYLSLPLTLKDVLLAAGLFFAMLLALTYLSRVYDARLAWSLLSPIFLGLSWGLGRSHWASWAAIATTISGAILPVLGLLVPYSGITLSLAGVLSIGWLALRHWYQPRQRESHSMPV